MVICLWLKWFSIKATGWLKIWDTLCGQPLRLDTRRDSHGHNRGLLYLSARILVAAAAAELHSDRYFWPWFKSRSLQRGSFGLYSKFTENIITLLKQWPMTFFFMTKQKAMTSIIKRWLKQKLIFIKKWLRALYWLGNDMKVRRFNILAVASHLVQLFFIDNSPNQSQWHKVSLLQIKVWNKQTWSPKDKPWRLIGPS